MRHGLALVELMGDFRRSRWRRDARWSRGLTSYAVLVPAFAACHRHVCRLPNAIELYLSSLPLEIQCGSFRAAPKPRHPLAFAREDAYVAEYLQRPQKRQWEVMLMDAPSKEFALAGSLEELKIKGRLVVHGGHRPILVIYDRGRVFALDNRCPHMGFPLERGSVEDGILTCHWHHARFDLESGCTFDLWADDVPICPVEVRNGDVWVKTTFGHADPAAHWHQRLADGLAHDLGLVIAKAVHGQLTADVPRADIVRQVALFGAQNRDGWGVGLTILTALANLLPMLPEEEAHLALFHGARRVAADCDGEAPRRERAPLDTCAPSRGGRAHPAHGDCGRSLAGGAGRCPARGRDRARVRRHRTLARFHQQGIRVPRPHRLGACASCAADYRRPDGGGPWRRGIDRLAPAR